MFVPVKRGVTLSLLLICMLDYCAAEGAEKRCHRFLDFRVKGICGLLYYKFVKDTYIKWQRNAKKGGNRSCYFRLFTFSITLSRSMTTDLCFV